MARVKVATLISGRGSNLKALLDACADPSFPAEIALVISNRAGAGGLDHAEAAGVATRVIDHRPFGDRDSFDRAVEAEIVAAGASLICLAGFMRLLGAPFTQRWHDRVLNIHPSLLPSFRGLDTHQRVLDAGVTITGCTVHLVRPALDDGPIIVQAAVPVLPNDDAEQLAARVLAQEHRIYPLALGLIASGSAKVVHERVVVPGCHVTASACLTNPAP